VLLVGAAAVALATGPGDDSEEPAPPPPPPTAGRTTSVPAAGIAVRVPRGWSASRSRRSVVLRGPGRSAAITVVAPPGGRGNAPVLRSALDELRRRYRVQRAGPGDGRRLAGLPTASAVVSARSRRARIKVLVAAVQGRRRSWLVEVFAAEGAPAARLVEGQVALGSLRLRG